MILPGVVGGGAPSVSPVFLLNDLVVSWNMGVMIVAVVMVVCMRKQKCRKVREERTVRTVK